MPKCDRCSPTYPAHRALTVSYCLRIKTPETWKAPDKKGVKAPGCRKRREERRAPFKASGGHTSPRALQRSGVFTGFQNQKGPERTQSEVLTLHLICSFGRSEDAAFSVNCYIGFALVPRSLQGFKRLTANYGSGDTSAVAKRWPAGTKNFSPRQFLEMTPN